MRELLVTILCLGTGDRALCFSQTPLIIGMGVGGGGGGAHRKQVLLEFNIYEKVVTSQAGTCVVLAHVIVFYQVFGFFFCKNY